MMHILRWLLGLCKHEWEDMGEVQVFSPDSRDTEERLPYAQYMKQRCECCGKYRRQKVAG